MGFKTVSNIKDRAKVRSTDRDIIGIHTMEAPENSQTAENVANYFKRVMADSHWCCDNNSRVRVIEDQFIAWTLPGANSRSLNLEFAGYAKQDAEDWADAYSVAMLEVGAYCAAEWVIKYNIPVRRLTAAQIRAGEKGFAGHVDVNRVYGQSSHWDPGPSFPWTYFLSRVRAAVNNIRQGVEAPEIELPNWNNHGYSMAWIKAQQAKLNDLGYKLVEDGKLGSKSKAAVKDFQKSVGLKDDGIPGPDTSKALDAKLARKGDGSPKKLNVKALERAVRAEVNNSWDADLEKRLNAVRKASNWGGRYFPWGIDYTQGVVGTKKDNVWGPNSEAAHDDTVVAVQTALRAMGFNPGKLDGKWGDNTENAYQAARRAS